MSCSISSICQRTIQGGDPTGLLGINGVLMNTFAWKPLNLTPLWMPPARRGSNVVVGGVAGTTPYIRRATETQHTIELAIIGDCDIDGVPYDDPWQGFYENIAYLRANVPLDPIVGGNGTVVALLSTPDGLTTLSADIQIDDFQLGDHDSRARHLATLDITIPAGAFA